MKKAANKNLASSQKIIFGNNTVIFYLIGIISITFVSYLNSFYNEFNYRDDDIYVLNNHLIKDLSLSGLKNIFTELYYNGHLPLTILSLAIDYHFWHLNPVGYHLTSFIIHAINIILVYRFIILLNNNQNVALLTAFIFAVHPMGVQSVSWIAERKNVLYAMFFLLSLSQYVHYLKKEKYQHLAYAFLFFVCSVASKWSAYTLPVVLLLLNWFFHKKIISKNLLFISIFFLVPFISYFLHIQSGATVEERFTFIDRIFFASYSYLFYILKAILPFNLSTIYPYPKKVDGEIPLIFYWSFPIALTIASIVIYRLYKFATLRREIIFGLLFFSINIGMVLNLLMFIGGHEMMADRYGYIPFIGLFFILSHFILLFWNKLFSFRNIILLGVPLYFVFLSISTYSRNKVWQNTISIYDDALAKYPATPIAHLNKAKYYEIVKENKKALDELNYCTENFSYYKNCFFDRGLLYFNNGYYEQAKEDFIKTISLDKSDEKAYNFLALTEINLGNYASSINYLQKSISLNNKNAMSYNNLGYAYDNMGNYSLAEVNYNKAIQLDSNLLLAYLNRGWMYINMKRYREAINDCNLAEKIDPKNALIFNNKGWAFYNLKQYENAINNFNIAINYDANLNYSYYNRALTYLAINNTKAACEDLNKAIELKNEDAVILYKKNCSISIK